jgi:uncharacterized protein YbbK (DUF523 family)
MFYNFSKLSHSFDIIGLIRKNKKYMIVNTCPIVTNGSSTGRPPIHVNTAHDDTKNQNSNWFIG